MFPLTELKQLLGPSQEQRSGIVVGMEGKLVVVATKAGRVTATTPTTITPGTRVVISAAGIAIPTETTKRYPV